MMRIKFDAIKPIIKKNLKWFFGIIGVFSFVLFVLSFTDIPYYAYHRLGTTDAKFSDYDVIVLLSGAGMPSPDGLIRTYYTVDAAQKYKNAKIIIACPYSEDEDSLSQLKLMANELIVKGIDSSRIEYEPQGFNTRSQAVNIATMYADKKSKLSVLLITSPEHLYRSIKTFNKAGFINVGGIPADEKPIDADKARDKENTKDTRVKSLALRYNMWSYLHYELFVLREYCAIIYYELKGWI